MPKYHKPTYKKKRSYKKYLVDQAQPGYYTRNRLMVTKNYGSERKEAVTSVSGSIPANGTVLLLNSIGQGNDINQRIGRVIKMLGCQYRYAVQGPTASINGDWLRVTLVWDSQSNNGFSPLYTDIFDNSAGGSPINWLKNTRQYADRFTLIKDETIAVQNQVNTNASGAEFQTYKTGYCSLRSFGETQFIATGSGMPGTGSLLLCISTLQNTGLSSTSASMAGNFKITFSDD